MEDKKIWFTPEKLKEFKIAYNRAVQEKQEVFTFEGNKLLVSYAKYLIEYLDSKIRPV